MAATRREFIKIHAAAAAAATAVGVTLAQAQAQGRDDGLRWDKGVCRYCGTGCGVLIGTKDGRIVATEADPAGPIAVGRPGADQPSVETRRQSPHTLRKSKYNPAIGRRWSSRRGW